MTFFRSVTITAAITLVASATASAQTCRGFTTFGNGNLRVDAKLVTGGGATGFGGQFNYGKPNNLFLGAGATISSPGSNFGVNGDIGYEFAVSGGETPVAVCPIASIGTTFITGATPVNIVAGGSVGAAIKASPTINIVPSGALAFQRQSGGGGSATGGLLDVGAGIAIQDRYTIRPGFQVNFGDFSGSQFTLAASINFGSSSRAARPATPTRRPAPRR